MTSRVTKVSIVVKYHCMVLRMRLMLFSLFMNETTNAARIIGVAM